MENRSRKQEERIAQEFGGRRVPGSGAFWHRKGDVAAGDYLLELKRTDAASFRITRLVWEKIRKEALLSGRMPAMVLEIQDTELVVLGKEDFLDLLATAQRDMGEGAVP